MHARSYERSVIEEWLADHDTSPLTGLKLLHVRLGLDRLHVHLETRTWQCFLRCLGSSISDTVHLKYIHRMSMSFCQSGMWLQYTSYELRCEYDLCRSNLCPIMPSHTPSSRRRSVGRDQRAELVVAIAAPPQTCDSRSRLQGIAGPVSSPFLGLCNLGWINRNHISLGDAAP